MFLKKLSLFVSVFSLFAFVNNAQAIPVNAKKILSFTTNVGQDLGYWAYATKFYTFRSNDNYPKPLAIANVNYKSASLAAIDFKEINIMGNTVAPGAVVNNQTTTNVKSGVVTMYGRNNQVLLVAEYVNAGVLSAIYKGGSAGQLNVNGTYKITGGSLFTSGTLTQNLFIDIAFNNIWQNKYKDFKATIGTYTIYSLAGGTTTGGTTGGTNIPEPATMSLLLSGVLGSGLLRRKK